MLNAATTMMKKSNTAITSFCMDSAAKRFAIERLPVDHARLGTQSPLDFGLDAHSLHRVGKAQFHPKMDWRALPMRRASSRLMKARRASYS